MATIGQQLLSPEAGWKRIDDRDSNISYTNGTPLTSSNGYWNDTVYKIVSGGSAKFNFTGDKLRIIVYNSATQSIFKLYIDGKYIGEYNANRSPIGTQMLAFDIQNLSNTEHYVSLEYGGTSTNSMIQLDAIDIDENGELKPYNENLSIIKYLIQDKTGSLKSVNTTDIINLGNQPISEELYLNNGFDDVTLLNNTYTKSKVYGTKDSDTATGQIFSVEIPSNAININSINLE